MSSALATQDISKDKDKLWHVLQVLICQVKKEWILV